MGASRLKKAIRLLLTLLGVWVVASSFVQAQQLPIKRYSTADGLARDQINRIVGDARGFLWFCTDEGLSRFDGYSFVNYTTREGLPHPVVKDLLETRDGLYFVATGGGVSQFNPEPASTERISLSSDRDRRSAEPLFVLCKVYGVEQVGTVHTLMQDRTGRIWCGTGTGLYEMVDSGGQATLKRIDIGQPTRTEYDVLVRAVVEDQQGALWVATGSGLYRHWPDAHTERYTRQDGLPVDEIRALLADGEGQVWAGTINGLCQIIPAPGGSPSIIARVYTDRNGLPRSNIVSLFQSASGKLWVGMPGGLCELMPEAKDASPVRRYLPSPILDEYVKAMAEDSNGNFWVGTERGALRVTRNGFTTYGKADGLAYAVVYSIFENRSGELCVSNAVDGVTLNRFDGRNFAALRVNLPKHIKHAGWGWSQTLLQDHQGEWWIPTGQGLCRFAKPARIEQLAHQRPKAVYTTKDGLPADDIFRLYEDAGGDIWIATFSEANSAIIRWDRATEKFHVATPAEGMPAHVPIPHAFCEDRAGNLWIGFEEGLLARYTKGRFTILTAREGVPPGWISSLYLDRSGRLWVATTLGGLSCVAEPAAEHPQFNTYTTAAGLSSNDIRCIVEDRWGRIFVGTGRGINRLNPATGEVKHYTTNDGLAEGEIRVAFRDRHDALWFGATRGLSKLIPEPDAVAPPPPILISRLFIGGEQQPLSELGVTQVPELRLEAGENQVQINFVGLSFSAGEQLKYQYKLEGVSTTWSKPSEQRSVNFANLSPGTYRFLVRAVSGDGTISPTPASVSFTILPPVWQRWWFISLALLALGSMMYAIYRYRLARLLELERVRTRIAADLHDDIGTSLSRMAILSEVVKQQLAPTTRQAVPILTEIADSARQLVSTMRDIVWAIDPRRDDLSSVIFRVREFASDMLEASQIQWDFRTPEDRLKLGPDQRRHLFLFFKEAITNTTRHAGCQRVWLSIELSHNQLIADVRDDGRGFTPLTTRDLTTNNHAGHGLENMQRRVHQLHGQLNISSLPGQGTHLKLIIPLKKS